MLYDGLFAGYLVNSLQTPIVVDFDFDVGTKYEKIGSSSSSTRYGQKTQTLLSYKTAFIKVLLEVNLTALRPVLTSDPAS